MSKAQWRQEPQLSYGRILPHHRNWMVFIPKLFNSGGNFHTGIDYQCRHKMEFSDKDLRPVV